MTQKDFTLIAQAIKKCKKKDKKFMYDFIIIEISAALGKAYPELNWKQFNHECN